MVMVGKYYLNFPWQCSKISISIKLSWAQSHWEVTPNCKLFHSHGFTVWATVRVNEYPQGVLFVKLRICTLLLCKKSSLSVHGKVIDSSNVAHRVSENSSNQQLCSGLLATRGLCRGGCHLVFGWHLLILQTLLHPLLRHNQVLEGICAHTLSILQGVVRLRGTKPVSWQWYGPQDIWNLDLRVGGQLQGFLTEW